jgi:hypothetical protein
MRLISDSSPLRKALTAPIRTLLVSAMLITPAAIAYADDDATHAQDEKKMKRQILKSLDEPQLGAEGSNDFSDKPWFSGFRVSKKGPIQYRQTLQIGDDEVMLKIYGPVVKKKPGLRFKVEGLNIGEHPARIEGYGNTKGGGLRFTVRF